MGKATKREHRYPRNKAFPAWEMRLKQAIYESTLFTADAVPLPQWGRLRYEDVAFLALSEQMHAYVGKQYRRTKPSPRGEGGERSEPDRVLAV